MNSMNQQSEELVTGNFYNKYESRNPIVKTLMNGFYSTLTDMRSKIDAKNIYEIGCGEGYLAPMLYQNGVDLKGCDISEDCVAKAKNYIKEKHIPAQFEVNDIYKLSPNQHAADLIICCEVLEHLPDPEKAVEVLASLAKPYLICSVPREPIWRVMNMARGKYWTDLGNTPGHLQNWSTAEFKNLIEKRFEILEVKTPLPWTFLRCKVKA